MLIGIKDTLEDRKPFHPKILLLGKNEIISRASIYPAMVCGLAYMGFGAIVTITPDQCVHFGMVNKGLYFTSFTICSVLSRLVAGTISDRYGRLPVMRFAIVLLAVAYFLFGQAQSPFWLLSASGFVGFSLGIVIPAVFAWTVDRSEDDNRGKSLATLFIGLETAIGFGAIIGAEIYDNNPARFLYVFYVIGALTLLGLFFTREQKSLPTQT